MIFGVAKVKSLMRFASRKTTVAVQDNVLELKQATLKRLYSSENVSERDLGYLKAIEDVERITQAYIKEMEDWLDEME